MTRAFLSHSSKDKNIVKKVADDLGSALAHYDERTFEPSGQSAEEILKALMNSNVFVYFLSKDALASPWVKRELEYARHQYFQEKISSIAIFPLDDSPRSSLAEWLRPFVVQTLRAPRLIALRIRSLLAQQQDLSISRFIGRDEAVKQLKDVLRDQSPNRPSAVLLAGINGMGRRRLVKRVFDDLYPFLPKHWIEIDISAYEGEAALYERLLEIFDAPLDWAESKRRADSFVRATPGDRTLELARLIREVESAKQVLVLQFMDDVITAEGNISAWLLAVIRAVKTSYPVLVIPTVRTPSPKALVEISDIPIIKLNSIDQRDAKQLLAFLCEDQQAGASKELLDQVVELVGGHPGLLQLSAKLIKAVGSARFKIDVSARDEKSALEVYVEKAISNLQLSQVERAILLLVEELGGATREDILVGFTLNPGDDQSFVLAKLIDFGFLEEHGGLLQPAQHLRLVMRRWKGERALQDLLIGVRKRLVSVLAEAESLAGGSYLALRGAISAAIRENGQFSNILVSQPLLAAQQLRVARRLYDERELSAASERAMKAYENRIALTDDGAIEVLRLLGLIGVRKKKNDLKEFSLSELDRISDIKSKKIAAFIRGFASRVAGNFSEAEAQLTLALKNGGGGDFHILRELAASLLEQGRPEEAEQYVRRSLAISPTNPYVLDITLACLIDRFGNDPGDRDLEKEIDGFMKRLAEADEREKRSFYPRRAISLAVARKDYSEADRILQGEVTYSGRLWYKISMADRLLKAGDARGALIELDRLYRRPEEEQDEGVSEFGVVRRIRVVALAEAGRLDEAVSEFQRNQHLFSQRQGEVIKKSIIDAVARSSAIKSDAVRKFALSA